MALQYSLDIRNAQLDAFESVIGASAVLKIRTEAPPSTCSQPDTGTVLATLSLPSDWMAAASGGAKVKLGTWETSSADASGTAQHFRIYNSGGSTCHAQGTVTLTGGGGDLTLDNVEIVAGQTLTISGFTLTAANS